VRGPDGRGLSAIIEQRQQFVREYSTFRVMARPAWPMGRWSMPGIGVQPGAPSNAPGLRQGSKGLDHPPTNQVARPDLFFTSEAMALVRNAVSGVTVLPGSSTASSADPRVGGPQMGLTERVGTIEDPPVRELSPVGPLGSADCVPHDEEEEEILATGYVPLRGSPFRSAPVFVPGEIPASLLGKLRSSGVFHLVEHYARWDRKIDDPSVSPPVREEAIVEMLCHTDELLANAQGEVDSVREMLKTAEERLVKAEARSDLLASACATFDAGRTAGRRQ
jgi:hypothetical protein